MQLSGDVIINVIFTSVKRTILNNTRVHLVSISVLYGNNINAKTSQDANEGRNIFMRSGKPGKDSKRKRIRIKIVHFNQYRKAVSKHEGQER